LIDTISDKNVGQWF